MSVRSIHEAQAKVDEILKIQKPKDVLVVLDIDMTLTQPDHPGTLYPAIKKYGHVLKDIFKTLTPAQRDVTLTLTTKLPQRLIEKDSPKAVKSMQDKVIKVIAFTACLSVHGKTLKIKPSFSAATNYKQWGSIFHFLPG